MVATIHEPEAAASFEVNTLNLDVGPQHRQLINYFNEYHEAVANGDSETCAELESIVPGLLDEFEATESREYINGPWLSAKMRAGWNVARCDYARALEFELEGWRHATAEPASSDVMKRRSISASNIADELQRLGRADEALGWAQLSVVLWPANAINHLVLAMTLYCAGLKDQADQVIEQLRQAARFGDQTDAISKCMSYERELHDMDDLPSVQRLLVDIRNEANRREDMP